MNIKQNEFLKISQRILLAIENLTHEDFLKLMDSSFRLDLKITRIRQKDNTIVDKLVLDDLIEQLENIISREGAQKFFIVNYPLKRDLEKIARELDISISKQDRIESIREKIIEATVGARLRSQAIQGSN